MVNEKLTFFVESDDLADRWRINRMEIFWGGNPNGFDLYWIISGFSPGERYYLCLGPSQRGIYQSWLPHSYKNTTIAQ